MNNPSYQNFFVDTNILVDLLLSSYKKQHKDTSTFTAENFNGIDLISKLTKQDKIKLYISPIAINELIRINKMQDLLCKHHPELNKLKNNDKKFLPRILEILITDLQNEYGNNIEVLDINKVGKLNYRDAIGELAYNYLSSGINKGQMFEINDLLLYAHASILGLPFLTNDHLFADNDIINKLHSTNIYSNQNPMFRLNGNDDFNKKTMVCSTPVFPHKFKDFISGKVPIPGRNRFNTLKRKKSIRNITNNYQQQLNLDNSDLKNDLEYRNSSLDEIKCMLQISKDFIKDISKFYNNNENSKLLGKLLSSSNSTRRLLNKTAISFINKLQFFERLYHHNFKVPKNISDYDFDIIRNQHHKIIGFHLNGIDYTLAKLPDNRRQDVDTHQKVNICLHEENITVDNFILYSLIPPFKKYNPATFVKKCKDNPNENLKAFFESEDPKLKAFAKICLNSKMETINQKTSNLSNYINFKNIENKDIENISIWVSPQKNKDTNPSM